jgi:hypothetical protein
MSTGQVLIDFSAKCEGHAYSCLQVVDFSRWMKLLTDASFKSILPLFSCAQNGEEVCYSFPSQQGLATLTSRYCGLEKCQNQILEQYSCQIRVSTNPLKVDAYRRLCGDRYYCGTCDFVTTCEELLANLDRVCKGLESRLTPPPPPEHFADRAVRHLKEMIGKKGLSFTLGDLCLALAGVSRNESDFTSIMASTFTSMPPFNRAFIDCLLSNLDPPRSSNCPDITSLAASLGALNSLGSGNPPDITSLIAQLMPLNSPRLVRSPLTERTCAPGPTGSTGPATGVTGALGSTGPAAPVPACEKKCDSAGSNECSSKQSCGKCQDCCPDKTPCEPKPCSETKKCLNQQACGSCLGCRNAGCDCCSKDCQNPRTCGSCTVCLSCKNKVCSETKPGPETKACPEIKISSATSASSASTDPEAKACPETRVSAEGKDSRECSETDSCPSSDDDSALESVTNARNSAPPARN